MGKKKPVIEGLGDELNKIAAQNLDFAPARRLVRSAFTQIQQNLDHCLFQVDYFMRVYFVDLNLKIANSF